jgi:hypothetical protein
LVRHVLWTPLRTTVCARHSLPFRLPDTSMRSTGPFLPCRAAIPFEASEIREKLGEKYEVQGIPRVVVLNAATGAVVDPDARAKITAKKALAGVFSA